MSDFGEIRALTELEKNRELTGAEKERLQALKKANGLVLPPELKAFAKIFREEMGKRDSKIAMLELRLSVLEGSQQ